MAISKEMEAEILRLHHAEGWLRGTIARQLGVHHSAVARVLTRNGILPAPGRGRKSKLEPYLPLIRSTLEKFPKLNATRLFHMARERGYGGGVDHFRDAVRALRPAPSGEAYLRLTMLAGEQAQVDWGHFGRLKIGDAEHRLLGFVMVLSYSRRIFLRFYLGDCTANFLRGHVDAFAHFGGISREILYDNLKSAVIERVEGAIRFNNELLDLSAHYRFAPKPVPVRRPTSKGRVERSIQYIRSSFFAARAFKTLDDLNEQALAWCVSEAAERACPGNRKITVAEAFETEQRSLLSLPDVPYPVFERKIVQVGKSPYVRFDSNDYSVPHQYVRRTLLVEASLQYVRIVDGIRVVAEHERSFDKGQQIEQAAHIEALEVEKTGASRSRGMDRILNVAPSARTYFKYAAERGHNMGRLTQLLIKWLELYGAAELEAALSDCIASATFHSNAIERVLEQRRAARGLAPAVALRFLKDRRVDEIVVKPKSLDAYERLVRKQENEE